MSHTTRYRCDKHWCLGITKPQASGLTQGFDPLFSDRIGCPRLQIHNISSGGVPKTQTFEVASMKDNFLLDLIAEETNPGALVAICLVSKEMSWQFYRCSVLSTCLSKCQLLPRIPPRYSYTVRLRLRHDQYNRIRYQIVIRAAYGRQTCLRACALGFLGSPPHKPRFPTLH